MLFLKVVNSDCLFCYKIKVVIFLLVIFSVETLKVCIVNTVPERSRLTRLQVLEDATKS